MFEVYILYSKSSGKTYVGYSSNPKRRLQEHNFTETSGFTLRYRPGTLIYTERFDDKTAAMKREKFLKTGIGRKFIHVKIEEYLQKNK